ncbi:MAG: tetratricopeptide repeat protein [Planctomycetes bacterium]|nr:tetratricopeptide repeat protein [Planctomycetota bacterium]
MYPAYGYPSSVFYPGYRYAHLYDFNVYLPATGYVAYATQYDTYATSDAAYSEPVVYQRTTTYETRAAAEVPAPAVTPPAAPPVEQPAQAAANQPPAEVPAEIRRGHELFGEGRYDEAREWFARAVFADDNDGYAKLFYCLGSFALGEVELAAVALRRALAAAPDLIEAPIDLRQFYGDTKALDGHLARLEQRVQENPADADARFLLGYMQYATGQAGKALESLKALGESSPTEELTTKLRDAVQRVVPDGSAPPQP